MNNFFKITNLHLSISVLIVIPVGICYGFLPNNLLDFNVDSTDLKTIFKAIMMVYLGFSSLWILGIYNNSYWRIASVTNCIFMLSLGFGRVISLILDGVPSLIFMVGIFGELLLGFYSFYIVKKHKSSTII